MNQKDKEISSFKRFFKSQEKSFDERLLNTNSAEPADLEYNGQGYQITTGDGPHIGTILSASKKYGSSDLVDRFMNKYDYVPTILAGILNQKKVRASKDVILLVIIHGSVPFTNDKLKDECEKFSQANNDLIIPWQTVHCIFTSKMIDKSGSFCVKL